MLRSPSKNDAEEARDLKELLQDLETVEVGVVLSFVCKSHSAQHNVFAELPQAQMADEEEQRRPSIQRQETIDPDELERLDQEIHVLSSQMVPILRSVREQVASPPHGSLLTQLFLQGGSGDPEHLGEYPEGVGSEP